MNIVEEALLFTCGDELLPAIVAWPQALSAAPRSPTTEGRQAVPYGGEDESGAAATDSCSGTPSSRASCGVLIVVGGPQYRVGSHRQFLLLSRRLASAGYPSMRFDYRGMGDASGAMRSFEDVSADIAAAIDAFQRTCPTVQRIVLWGLCDAASAALLYVQANADSRIVGLALLNPWVRSDSSLAQTHIKHYYRQRLLQAEFWRKLLRGKLAVLQSLRGLLSDAWRARTPMQTGKAQEVRAYQELMADGWRRFPGKLLLILSGQDYTAKEFLEFTASNAAWAGLTEAAGVNRIDLADADHTFSSKASRAQVEDATLGWLDTLPTPGERR